MLQIIILIGIINYLILIDTEMNDGIKAYVMIMATILILWMFTTKDMIEGLDTDVQNLSYEAIQNIASMYNNGTMKVTNLEVSGNAKINGNATIGGNTAITGSLTSNDATIGKWHIRDNRIGMPGGADIWNSANQNDYIHIYEYDKNTFRNNGIAANNFWETDNSLSNKYIHNNSNINLSNSHGNLTTCTWGPCNGAPWPVRRAGCTSAATTPRTPPRPSRCVTTRRRSAWAWP